MRQWIAVVLMMVGGTASALADPGGTFLRPYQDGAVIVLWKDGYTQAQIDALLARSVQAGVRSIEVPIFGCQSDTHSADVGSCEVGTRDQAMLILRRAVAAGLGVSVLPIVATPVWDWRGKFDPTDVDGWFKTYTAWLTEVAQEVSAAGASELSVGSEFELLYQYSDRWTQLLHDIRPVFHGPLIVTTNWDQLDHDFWGDADAIGISSYFPLASAGQNPSQDDLDRAWSKWKSKLLSVSKKWDRPLYFTEVGYNSTTEAAVTPWSWTTGAGENVALQAQCFGAMQTAWAAERNLVRAQVWAIGDPDLVGNGQPAFDFLNTPSESVLSAFFAARSALSSLIQ